MGPPQRRATRMWARKKRWSILNRRLSSRGPTAHQPGSVMKAAASTSAAARSWSGGSSETSGTERQPPRALPEAQLDQQRPDGGTDHGLAVEALDAQAREAPAAHLAGHRLERLAQAVVVLLAQRQQALATPLHVQHGLGVESHHVGARHPHRAPAGVLVALGPGDGGAVGIGGVGG